MAKKSKTQRAKASAARAARKEARQLEEQSAGEQAVSSLDSQDLEKPKKSLFKKSDDSASSTDKLQDKKLEKKSENKPAAKHFQFLRDVKSEMKRVTWPTRQDVLQWSGVVVAALLFFGIYVAVLDNAIITPILVLISGLGA